MPPDENDISDASLVRRVAAGDSTAFTVLFERHYDRVREFAYRVVLDGHAADDVAQETFIRAARKLASMHDGQAFVAWVFRIASNVAKGHLRSQRAHERKIKAAELAGPETDSEDAGIDDEKSRLALRTMQSLPPKQREAVALVILDGLSHAEASQRLGCAESTVSWRIFCAKRTLRRKLLP